MKRERFEKQLAFILEEFEYSNCHKAVWAFESPFGFFCVNFIAQMQLFSKKVLHYLFLSVIIALVQQTLE